MESYGGTGRANGNAPPHYSDLSNPQIIETLQKQGNFQAAQQEDNQDTQSQD